MVLFGTIEHIDNKAIQIPYNYLREDKLYFNLTAGHTQGSEPVAVLVGVFVQAAFIIL